MKTPTVIATARPEPEKSKKDMRPPTSESANILARMNLSIARIEGVYCKNERRLLRKLKAPLANENIKLVVMKTSNCE